MQSRLLLFAIIFIAYSCGKEQKGEITYSSDSLKIIPVTEHAFQHISYLKTEKYGNVPCNGLIYITGDTAVIFDTPIDDSASLELIQWLQNVKNCYVKSIYTTHFHIDCLGGLHAFNKTGIPSFALNKTIQLAQQDSLPVPKIGFDSNLTIKINGEEIDVHYFGEGHTIDNVVVYIPKEKLLFGGCLIKALGAGKGNLADANISEWSNTVRKIKNQYSEVKIVIPGHGKLGGKELLNYTIDLFTE